MSNQGSKITTPWSNEAPAAERSESKPSATRSVPGHLEAEESRLIWCSHIFNAILFCAGVGAMCIALWLWIELSTYESRDAIIALIGPLYYVANFAPLAEGGAILFIMAVGAVGLCFKSRCTLVWYFGMLLLLCTVSLVIAIISFTLYFELSDSLRMSMKDKIEFEYGTNGGEEITKYIDSIQREFRCCGSSGYYDWHQSMWRATHSGNIPSTCCVTTNTTSSSSSSSSSSSLSSSPIVINETQCTNSSGTASEFPNHFMYSTGCHVLIQAPFDLTIVILGGVSTSLFLIQLVSLTVVVHLFKRMGPISPSKMKFSDSDTAKERLDKLDYWLERESKEIRRESAKRKKKNKK